MANLSVTQAWNETTAFLKREAGLVFPIALLLLALPGAAMQLAMPMEASGEMPQLGLWFLILFPLVFIASLIGTIAISYLALRPGTSVGEALEHGLRRFVFLLAATLLLTIALALIALPIFYLAGLGDLVSGEADPVSVAGKLLLAGFVLFVVLIFFWVRLLLMTPVGTMEPVGPIAIIRRSWELTSGHFWKLLGFILLIAVAAGILMLVVSAIFGIVVFAAAGPPEPGSTSLVLTSILSALLQALLSAVFVVLIARIYAQLAGSRPEEVFA